MSGVQTIQRILHYYSAVPIWDYWRVVQDLPAYQRFYLPALWRQHNEHRIIFPELVFALDMLFMHGRQILPLAFSFLCYVLTFAILAANFCSDGRVAWTNKIIAICLAGVVVFWQGCASALASAFLLQWTLLQLCIACALTFLVSVKQTGQIKYLAYVIIAAVVATYSSGNGLFLWPLLVAGGLLLKIGRRQLGILAISGLVFGGAYFIGYRFTGSGNMENPLKHLLYFIQFSAAYLGMPFSESTNLYPELNVPVLGICIGLFNLISVLFFGVVAWRRGMLASRPGIVLFGTYAFTLCTVLITAVGRMYPADPTARAAVQPRYLTVPLMNWAATLFIYFWFAGLGRRSARLVPVIGAIFAMFLAIGLSQMQRWLGSESKAFAEYQLTALSLQDGLVDSNLLLKIFPSAEFVKVNLSRMQTNKLSIYYKWQGRWLGKDISTYSRILERRVPGAIHFTYPVTSGVEIAGWADESSLQRNYKWVVLTNEQGQIVGFGEKLPAGFPGTLPAWQMPPSLGWVGFVNLRVPAKMVSAYLVDDRRIGLFRVGDAIALPIARLASLQQSGPSLPGVTWSGDQSWATGRLPLVIPGDAPNGPIYSSWAGSDRNTGEWQSSVFAVPTNGCVILPVLHGPRVEGLSVTLADADSNEVLAAAPMEDDDTRWNFWRVPVPPSTHRLRMTAADKGLGWGEWVAIANPAECR